MIQKLVEARLIVTNEVQAKGNENERVSVVDVAREALIRHWSRLRRWLDEDRGAIRFERRLDAAINHWTENGRHENLLWRSPFDWHRNISLKDDGSCRDSVFTS